MSCFQKLFKLRCIRTNSPNRSKGKEMDRQNKTKQKVDLNLEYNAINSK